MIFVFLRLPYFTSCDNLCVCPCCCSGVGPFFLLAEWHSTVSICTTLPLATHLLMASRLLPGLGYQKQCCHEHWGAYVCLNHSFSLDFCPGVELLDHMATLVLDFWGTSILFCFLAAPIYIPTHSVGGLHQGELWEDLAYVVENHVITAAGAVQRPSGYPPLSVFQQHEHQQNSSGISVGPWKCLFRHRLPQGSRGFQLACSVLWNPVGWLWEADWLLIDLTDQWWPL